MKEQIVSFLTNIQGSLIAQYQSKGLRAFGTFQKELRHTADETGGKIYGPGHAVQMVLGRRPGAMPPIQAIEDWIQAKGLDLSPWAVAKSIARRGTSIYRGDREGLDIKESVDKHKDEFTNSLIAEQSMVIRATISLAFKQSAEALKA